MAKNAPPMSTSSPKRAMVMAAGKGTRMRELTAQNAKPLLKAGGLALIDHALTYLNEAGVDEAVVNTHWQSAKLQAHLAQVAAPKITISDESAQLLETGGGMKKALPLLGNAPVYCLNSDAIFTGPPPLRALAGRFDPEKMDALLLVVRRENAVNYTRAGDFFLSNEGNLSRRGNAEHAPYVFTGAQIIKPTAFANGPEGAFSTNLVWDKMLQEGRLYGAVYEGGWIDVGTPEGLQIANDMLK